MFSAATEDYEPLVNEQVAFLVGDVVGTSSCVSLQIINDTVVELDESFDVVLTSNDPSVAVDPTTQTEVSITDDDSEFQCICFR